MNQEDVARAQLVSVFIAEAEESLGSLDALAAHVREGGDSVREFGRLAHGLKGAAGSLGYASVAHALHVVEALALGAARAEPAAAEERVRRIAAILEVLREGVARMAASGGAAFPDDLAATLAAAAAAGAGQPAEATAAATHPAAGAPGRPLEAAERLSVPAADVDAALRLASSLARSAAQLQEALHGAHGDLAPAAQSLAATASGLEAIIGTLRLIPAEAALSGLDDEVTELAGRLGKRVALGVHGREVRADRRTLQSARGMIRHLVRNALDHGLEPPAVRTAAGKQEGGHLTVRVAAGESMLRVAVEDDGGGFDTAAIRAELARRAGDAERTSGSSDEEILQRWAIEGGSTRATANEISGRGLGLSAVAATARAGGGTLRVRSFPGRGSVIEFTLPLEVYAVDALTVVAGGRAYALPLAAIERSLHLASAGDSIHDGPTGRTLVIDETILPLRSLAEALGVGGASGAERFAVVVRGEDGMAALAVDEVGAVNGVVPASVPGVAQAEALATGIARLGDGTAVVLLNPRVLVASTRRVRSGPRPASTRIPSAPPAAARGPARAIEVVLAEDSLATREVLRVLLEQQGYRVRLAADGEEALQRISERAPDVVVSDVNMPRRDGLSLTRVLRGRADTERLPIVLLTSQDDDATRAAGAAAGADAYLLKSRFNAEVLARTLAQLGVRSA